MQKLEKKQNANAVGANCVRPYLEGMAKENNGITLIALIITIIVMLILVVVTINVALNGGLFNTADEATTKTEKHAIYDQIVGAMKLKNNGNVNVKETYEAIVDILGADKVTAVNPETVDENSTEVTFTVAGKRGTYNYIISETEIKIGGSDVPPLINSDFEKYIMGSTGQGRALIEFDEEGTPIGGITNLVEFLDDPLTEEVDETETLGVEFLTGGTNEDNTKVFIYAKYDDKAYKITCDETAKSEKLELIYEPKGTEGQKTADGWTILYDNGETVEAVSPEVMERKGIGPSSATTGSDVGLKQAIESYNNAITIINNSCKSLMDNLPKSNVRSVGSATETSDEASNKYTSPILEEWNSTYKGVGKKGDILFEQDLVRMAYYDVLATGTEYWMASRVVQENSSDIYFCVRTVNANGYLDSSGPIWYVFPGGAREHGGSYAVRPIITIQKGL